MLVDERLLIIRTIKALEGMQLCRQLTIAAGLRIRPDVILPSVPGINVQRCHWRFAGWLRP